MTGRLLTPYSTTLTVYGALLLQIGSQTTKTQSFKSLIQNFAALTPHRLTHLPQDGKTAITTWYPRLTWYQSHKTSKIIQRSRHSRGTILALSVILAIFTSICPDLLGTRVIKHLKSSKGQGTLVVPFWPSASFWPFLQAYNSKELNSYVVDFKVFTQPHQFFQLGNNNSSLIGSSKFKSQILACSRDFRENK